MTDFRAKGANETDVREEFLSRVLNRLGYSRGSSNDIQTEFPLYYNRVTLGRRKKSDPVIKGKIDYLLRVGGLARWVLEAKAPKQISSRDIDQVLSYARHPEVAAVYAAICDGIEFRLYRSSQMSDDEPLLRFEVTSVTDTVERLQGTLNPECIARDYRMPHVSEVRPIADGRSACEEIVGGISCLLELEWSSDFALTDADNQKSSEIRRRLIGMQTSITGGEISREVTGRIVARLDWSAPHKSLTEFSERKGLNRQPLVCLTKDISRNPEEPSLFESYSSIDITNGEALFDIVDWRDNAFEHEAKVRGSVQVLGFLDGSIFVGFSTSLFEFREPEEDEVLLTMRGVSSIELYLRP